MSRRPFRPLSAALLALTLTLGGVACSSDGGSATDDGPPSAPEPAAGTETGGDTGGGDRAFGVGRDDLAVALAKATSADDHTVDGSTIVLIFSTGSKDAPKAAINCSAASAVAADDDEVVLRYPDGTFACADLDRGGDS